MRQSDGSSDVRKTSHYTRLILPGALWILRFKRNIFLPFLSLDLCFLSVVTRTSRFSLRGKPREKRGLEATGELRIRSKFSAKGSFSCLYPFSTLFPLVLLSTLSSCLYYVDPTDVVYFTSTCIASSPILETATYTRFVVFSFAIRAFIMNVYIVDKIPSTYICVPFNAKVEQRAVKVITA